jgi:cell division protein FtsA|tara:strand:+ start:1449 stop:2642 length:1194 start_codon:yes stop_codon:yes gene_type:complete
MNNREILIIDIGTSSIKSFIIKKDDKTHKVVGVGKSVTSGFMVGQVINFDDFINSIQKSINQAQRQASIKVNECFLLLQSSKNKNHLISESLLLNDIQIEDNHLRKLDKIINLKINSNLIHFFKSHYTIDKNIVTTNPIGITCNKISLHAIITSPNKSELQIYKNCFSKIGLTISKYYDSSIIYFLYLKSLNLHKKNIVFIDIGFSSTKILIVKNEKISLLHTLPVGSNYITNDIVRMLHVNADFAETLKLTKVDLISEVSAFIEIPVWEELGTNLKRKIEHDYLKSIVTSRIDEIFNLILSNIPNSKFFYSYLLTGGGSLQKNIRPYIHKRFSLDVELIEPNQISGIPKLLNSPSLMGLFSFFEIYKSGLLEKFNLLKKNDSFSNKIWYKRILDLL